MVSSMVHQPYFNKHANTRSQVGAPEYRRMRAAGETPLPSAVLLDSASTYSIPSRDSNVQIPCRVLKPQDGSKPTAVYMHIHGGGWVLQDEKSQDTALQYVADQTGMLAVSIGYRLAPEHPFPTGPEDCYDAAEWLVDNAEKELGAPLGFVGGESAGAHLSMLVCLHLLQHVSSKYSSFAFRGLILNFGVYDLTFTPQCFNFEKPVPLVLDIDLMIAYRNAALPGVGLDKLKDPKISPLYTNLYGLKLPAALFTCGTEDCLLDDTIFMSSKWLMAGGDAIVKIFPGAPHGYIMFPLDTKDGGNAKAGMESVVAFVKQKLE